jgi:hypothetical protein
VREGTRTFSDWQMNYERDRPISVCRKAKVTLAEGWPAAKMFV